MDSSELKSLLKKVQAGQIDLDTAFHELKKLPFEDIGYAKVDTHRCLRNGVPEVIYCEGKTIPQIQGIVEKISQHHCNILATRASLINKIAVKGSNEGLAPHSHDSKQKLKLAKGF